MHEGEKQYPTLSSVTLHPFSSPNDRRITVKTACKNLAVQEPAGRNLPFKILMPKNIHVRSCLAKQDQAGSYM